MTRKLVAGFHPQNDTIRRGGVLATLDTTITSLLAPKSPELKFLEAVK